LALSAGTPARDLAGLTSLPPVSLLDGFGHAVAPPADAMPVPAKEFSHIRVSPQHGPGLYGAHDVESALNVLRAGDRLAPLELGGLQDYGNTHAKALEPYLLAAAMLLLLLDALVSLWLRGFTPGKLRWAGSAAALLLTLHLTAPQARADEATSMKAALDTRLAYVKTGLQDVDSVSEAGLTGLGLMLRARTSYEPLEPIGLDPEQDDLSLYPLLYWPMDPREKSLSPKGLARIGDYMRNGGTILFDTQDQNAAGAIALGQGGPGTSRLRQLVHGLDIPPLVPVPQDHVLTRSFYLLQQFPGRWAGGQLWVERNAGRINDGVSSVLIGGNDWAGAWAVDDMGQPLYPTVPGGERQREMAYRFGINLVMYALTGNYKSDQVHVPAILERLGQ